MDVCWLSHCTICSARGCSDSKENLKEMDICDKTLDYLEIAAENLKMMKTGLKQAMTSWYLHHFWPQSSAAHSVQCSFCWSSWPREDQIRHNHKNLQTIMFHQFTIWHLIENNLYIQCQHDFSSSPCCCWSQWLCSDFQKTSWIMMKYQCCLWGP